MIFKGANFFLVFCLIISNIYCQDKKNAVLTGSFYIKEGVGNTFYLSKMGNRTSLNYNADYEAKLSKSSRFSITVKENSPSFYKIGDMYVGHTIFLEPNDSVNITLSPIKGWDERTKKGEDLYTGYILKTNAKYYGNIIFYDELFKKIGVTIKYKYESPEAYKKKCDAGYKTAIDLLNYYKSKNAVSPLFCKYALEDLKARYVLWLCEMVSEKHRKDIPPSLLSEVNKWSFNDSTLFVSSDKYAMTPAVYNYYIANSFNPNNWYQNLDKEVSTILKNYTGIIKDRVLGWGIEDYIGKRHPAFDSCYKVFLAECKNEKIKQEVVYKVESYIPPVKKINNLTLKEVFFRTQLKSINDNKTDFDKIISKDKLTVIDCWATWCYPCRLQIPFMEEIEKQYAGQINVIYLSFDKDEMKWKDFVNKNELSKNQYIINNDFSSDFSNYFEIASIPRYILISQNSTKVLNSKMPLPGLKNEFEKELKKYIN